MDLPPRKSAECEEKEFMTEKANRARAFGMMLGIVALMIALLVKRLSR